MVIYQLQEEAAPAVQRPDMAFLCMIP